jgi:serine/threonine protein kinase
MDDKFYDYSSDIWSIGMVVYEMATGKHPYPETSNPLELHECMKTSPSPTLAGYPNLSPEIVDFVSRWYSFLIFI